MVFLTLVVHQFQDFGELRWAVEFQFRSCLYIDIQQSLLTIDMGFQNVPVHREAVRCPLCRMTQIEYFLLISLTTRKHSSEPEKRKFLL